MVVGYHMLNGFKRVEITPINVYGRTEYNFKFYTDNMIVRDTNTDCKARFIKALSEDYYFEENGNPVEIQ